MTELTNEQIAGVETLNRKASALIDNDTEPDIAALIGHVPALCATVRALRAKLDRIKSNVAWHRDGIGPDVPVLQERYDKLIAQRNDLQSQLEQVTKERDDLRRDNGKLSSVIFNNKHAQLTLSSAVALCRDKAAKYKALANDSLPNDQTGARLAASARTLENFAAELEQLK